MNIPVRKLDERARLPRRGSAAAAGADLCALDGTDIAPGETVMIHTGLAAEIPDGYVGLLFARSGLSTKSGLAPANKVGVVDSDYRGELMVALHNHSDQPRTVAAGERVAQLVIMPYVAAVYVETDQLSETERGEGGYGSTGSM
ncbi:MAG: dUTP diphosphatase [Ruminococcaceae bacterium]|nr:dUTP diphosphatase [Oscillospiraceae bacterium]